MTRPPFVDTHVHFHELGHEYLTYSWLEFDVEPDPDLGDYSAIKSKRYWADDFVAETRLSGVAKVVHVQAAIGTEDPVSETRWLQEFAERTGVPQGIVAYCDLGADDARDVLERHAAYANVRGVRDLRYDDYLVDHAWQSGFALLEEFGLVACDDPLLEHMADAAALASAHPGVTYCVDHAGFPRERNDDYFNAWRVEMAKIAAVPNTVVKISGLGMCDHTWTRESIEPWVLACVELWGTDRAFFGSNWPVDRLYSSYGDVLDAYWQIVQRFSPAEQDALFFENASRVFRLGP